MNEERTVRGIGREGSFLWQINDDVRQDHGVSLNLWSGKLGANNGYDAKYAERAAVLFVAAPDLLQACERAAQWLEGWASAEPQLTELRAAIAKATASPSLPTPV